MNVPSESDSQSRPISVRLDDFLKLQGLVGTGGEAKVRIQAGEVKVNDMVETRRRKQLSEGDRIEFDGNHYLVELNDL
ncbi:MAG: RNA-binding S4 domain-containing protein [Planctomycetota bacterium]|nr:RNA-binding S4 domain-containing protein [Planctomycetota bacterium]MEC7679788.1 RNA-binding S4 domain-containing protein [Planctomycetota bacterium]